MAKRNNKPAELWCEMCANCCAIGGGDFICDVSLPVLVIEGYAPADEYYICEGKNWEER